MTSLLTNIDRWRASAFRWMIVLLAPCMLTACLEVSFPTGPEPTGRALITIVEPPIGATRVAALGQPATTMVITNQPYKTIQGEVIYPAGGLAGEGILPAAAPGMYYFGTFGVSFIVTHSGIYRHQYMSFNEFGVDVATGLFTVLVNHSFSPEGPYEVCDEEGCDDDTPPPPGTPYLTYKPDVLTPDPYVSDEVASGITEADVHAIAQQSSIEFLEYTADQYGDDVEDWLIENGYLTASLDVQLGFVERIDRYITIVEGLDEAAVSVPGFSSPDALVRVLRRLQDVYTSKQLQAQGERLEEDRPVELRVERRNYLEVFPNPATDRVMIRVPGQESALLRIFNAAGQSVYQAEPGPGAQLYEWDLTSNEGTPVPPGQYFITVDSAEKTSTGSVTIVR